MKPAYFFDRRRGARTSFRNALPGHSLNLFLDYDGTLAPIRSKPSQAVLPPSAQTLLHQLSAQPHTNIIIVTGRSLRDVRALVRVKGIDYIANHGFEMLMRGNRWVHPEAKRKQGRLAAILKRLKTETKLLKGIELEDKQFTLSIHYRNASTNAGRKVRAALQQIIRDTSASFSITHGKKVLEIRPTRLWNKGYAVKKFLAASRTPSSATVIYIGDDTTDEDAFRMLRSSAISVVVGRNKNSHARYYFRNQKEVLKFLRIILKTPRNLRKG